MHETFLKSVKKPTPNITVHLPSEQTVFPSIHKLNENKQIHQSYSLLPEAKIHINNIKKHTDALTHTPQRNNSIFTPLTKHDKHSDKKEINTPELSTLFPIDQITPLVAAKIAVPKQAGKVDITKILPQSHKKFLLDPSLILKTNPPPPKHKIKPKHSNTEYVKTVKKLTNANMIHFSQSPKCVNGVFGVKKKKKIRFILDARNANDMMHTPPSPNLPKPDIFTKIRSSSPFYTAKLDLSNYFHSFSMPSIFWEYFAMPAVKAEDVGLGHKYPPGTLIYPCIKTLPMGWSFSVFFAQAAHDHLSKNCPFTHVHFVSESKFRTLSGTLGILYIDDVILLGTNKLSMETWMNWYVKHMTSHGFDIALSKLTPPTKNPISALGFTITGRTQTVSISIKKLNLLLLKTNTILQHKKGKGKQIQRLLGSWAWFFLLRRPFFSLFQHAYTFARKYENKTTNIHQNILLELALAAALAPLLVVFLNKKILPSLIATDASSQGGGGCIHHNVHIDTLTSFLNSTKPCPLTPLGESCYSSANIAHLKQWAVFMSHKWKKKEPIAYLEMQAIIDTAKLLSHHKHTHNHHITILCDSACVLAATNKGRSSVFPMLRRLRTLLLYSLKFSNTYTLKYINTKHNPADEPSRELTEIHPLFKEM